MSEIRGQKSEEQPRSQRKLSVCCLIVPLCLLFSALCPLVEADELRVGYVNLSKVFDEYQRTQESEELLGQKGKQKQEELESRFNELKRLRQSLELLSDKVRESKAKELEEKSDEFQRQKTRSERGLLRERDQTAKEILDEIEQTVAEYAKANGFSLILDQRSLLYGQDAYDVTDDVLRLLNDRYALRTKKGQVR